MEDEQVELVFEDPTLFGVTPLLLVVVGGGLLNVVLASASNREDEESDSESGEAELLPLLLQPPLALMGEHAADEVDDESEDEQNESLNDKLLHVFE